MNEVPFHKIFEIPLRNGLTRPSSVRGAGISFVNMGEIFAYDRLSNQNMELVQVSEAEKSKYLLRSGDLLFARQSLKWDGAGKVSIFVGSSETTFESHLIRARLNSKIADPRFYYYFFRSSAGRTVMESIIEQVAAAGIRGSDLANLPVPLPPLSYQRQVADTLWAFEDKIDHNQLQCGLLEEMSQALFKSWFVDFDPVVAKSEGRRPFGMSDDIAALFPDSFEESELGAVPKGWRVESLASEFSITMGQSPPGTSYNEHGEGTLFFQGRGEFGQRYPTPRLFTTAPTRLAKAYDTLVTVRAPVGDINQCLNDCCIGRGLAAIRHNQDSKAYTFYRFRNLTAEFESFNGDGTLFGSVTGDGLRGIKHVVPPKSVRVAFETIAGTLDDKVRLNHIESETLTKMRDSLLPQLLSGDVNLKSANQLCTEATAA